MTDYSSNYSKSFGNLRVNGINGLKMEALRLTNPQKYNKVNQYRLDKEKAN